MANMSCSVLIVVDMQNDFLAAGGYYDLKEKLERRHFKKAPPTPDEIKDALINRGGAAKFILRRSVRPRTIVTSTIDAIKEAMKQRIKIFPIRAAYGEKPRANPAFVTRHPEYYPCPKDHWGSRFIEPLEKTFARRPGRETLVQPYTSKPHYDAFFETNLACKLDAENHRGDRRNLEILIGGAETEVCVLKTAQTASTLGFKTTILVDCVASSNDGLAKAALEIFGKAFGEVKCWRDVFHRSGLG